MYFISLLSSFIIFIIELVLPLPHIESTIFNFINYHSPNIYYKSFKFYQVGKFISHSSSLAKATSWGDKEDDYVIIYEPDGFYKDEKGNIKSTYIYNGERITYSKDNTDSYNDMKSNMAFSDRKKNRRVEYEKKENSVYKWVKDLFGTYQPYANGKNSKMFEFGLKLSEYDYNSLYGDDGYCNKIAL